MNTMCLKIVDLRAGSIYDDYRVVVDKTTGGNFFEGFDDITVYGMHIAALNS